LNGSAFFGPKGQRSLQPRATPWEKSDVKFFALKGQRSSVATTAALPLQGEEEVAHFPQGAALGWKLQCPFGA